LKYDVWEFFENIVESILSIIIWCFGRILPMEDTFLEVSTLIDFKSDVIHNSYVIPSKTTLAV
jgi:hypothetical protein